MKRGGLRIAPFLIGASLALLLHGSANASESDLFDEFTQLTANCGKADHFEWLQHYERFEQNLIESSRSLSVAQFIELQQRMGSGYFNLRRKGSGYFNLRIYVVVQIVRWTQRHFAQRTVCRCFNKVA